MSSWLNLNIKSYKSYENFEANDFTLKKKTDSRFLKIKGIDSDVSLIIQMWTSVHFQNVFLV